MTPYEQSMAEYRQRWQDAAAAQFAIVGQQIADELSEELELPEGVRLTFDVDPLL